MAYRQYYNVDTRIVRIFKTHGPRMQLNDGSFVPKLCEADVARRTFHGLRQRLSNSFFPCPIMVGLVVTCRAERDEVFPGIIV